MDAYGNIFTLTGVYWEEDDDGIWPGALGAVRAEKNGKEIASHDLRPYYGVLKNATFTSIITGGGHIDCEGNWGFYLEIDASTDGGYEGRKPGMEMTNTVYYVNAAGAHPLFYEYARLNENGFLRKMENFTGARGKKFPIHDGYYYMWDCYTPVSANVLTRPERIILTFNQRLEVDGYSRMVGYDEILEDNDGNLNVPRYIQRASTELPQDIAAHLQGGIPAGDLDSLAALWQVAPNLKKRLFTQQDSGRFALPHTPDELAAQITADEMLTAQKTVEVSNMLASWADACAKPALLGVNSDTHPRLMIREVGEELLGHYADAKVLDPYDAFDVLMNYWNARLQDDVYIIKASGFEAGREVEYAYKQKKTEDGQTTDTGQVKGFEGLLIPATIIEAEYFPQEQAQLAGLDRTLLSIEADLETLLEEQPEEDNPFAEVLSSTGKVVEKELNARLKALDDMKKSPQLDVLDELIDKLVQKNTIRVNWLLEQHPDIAALDLYGKSGKPIKTKLAAARQQLAATAPVPEAYRDEHAALANYRDKLNRLKAVKKQVRAARDELDQKVLAQYGKLTEDEIKHLLFDRKWLPHLQSEISDIFDQQVNAYATRITDIARRYERTLPAIEDAVERSRTNVMRSLERMGYTW